MNYLFAMLHFYSTGKHQKTLRATLGKSRSKISIQTKEAILNNCFTKLQRFAGKLQSWSPILWKLQALCFHIQRQMTNFVQSHELILRSSTFKNVHKLQNFSNFLYKSNKIAIILRGKQQENLNTLKSSCNLYLFQICSFSNPR